MYGERGGPRDTPCNLSYPLSLPPSSKLLAVYVTEVIIISAANQCTQPGGSLVPSSIHIHERRPPYIKDVITLNQ